MIDHARNLRGRVHHHWLVLTAPILLVLVQFLGVHLGGLFLLIVLLSIRGEEYNLALVLTIADITFTRDTVVGSAFLGELCLLSYFTCSLLSLLLALQVFQYLLVLLSFIIIK